MKKDTRWTFPVHAEVSCSVNRVLVGEEHGWDSGAAKQANPNNAGRDDTEGKALTEQLSTWSNDFEEAVEADETH